VRGGTSRLTVTVFDDTGAPLNAVVPMEVTIHDPDGRTAEFSGYYGAAGGTLNLDLNHAPNDTAGVWTVKARELATGRTALHFFRLSHESP
jgi:hypothetical protein